MLFYEILVFGPYSLLTYMQYDYVLHFHCTTENTAWIKHAIDAREFPRNASISQNMRKAAGEHIEHYKPMSDLFVRERGQIN